MNENKQVKIFNDIHPQVDLETLLRGLGGGGDNPQIRDEAKWACTVVEELARPRGMCGLCQFELGETGSLKVIAPDNLEPVRLEIGKRGVELLKGAKSLQISFVTLGNGVQKLAAELKSSGDMLKDYLLDTALVFALYHAGQVINQFAEETARAKSWGVGPRLSPGSLQSWPLEDQAVLADLLPIAQIGMEIRSSSLLYPLKSASSMVGMGPGYTDSQVGTVCRWCRNQKNCPIQMAGLNQQPACSS